MKRCSACLQEKESAEFSRSENSLQSKCRQCANAYIAEYRKKNAAAVSAYDKARDKLPARADQRRVRIAKDKIAHPERVRARLLVQRSVRSGRIEKYPCMVCGNSLSEGHHADYERPLDVVWLCSSHHKLAHALVPRGKTNYAEEY